MQGVGRAVLDTTWAGALPKLGTGYHPRPEEVGLRGAPKLEKERTVSGGLRLSLKV